MEINSAVDVWEALAVSRCCSPHFTNTHGSLNRSLTVRSRETVCAFKYIQRERAQAIRTKNARRTTTSQQIKICVCAAQLRTNTHTRKMNIYSSDNILLQSRVVHVFVFSVFQRRRWPNVENRTMPMTESTSASALRAHNSSSDTGTSSGSHNSLTNTDTQTRRSSSRITEAIII